MTNILAYTSVVQKSKRSLLDCMRSFGRLWGDLFPHLSQLPEAPSCILKVSSVASPLLSDILPPSHKDPSDYIGPT